MKRNLRYMHWQIAYRTAPHKEFRMVNNPEWAWAADPFLVEYNGDIFLFAELFLYNSERNGVLGYCQFKNDGFSEWKVTMDEHWHLSYPNVFVKNGRLLLCPESYQKNEVGIYELKEFPDSWMQRTQLISNVRFVDTTFFEYKKEKYMMTFSPTFKGDEGKLLLYKILKNNQLSKPVVVTDDKSLARPGGNFIYEADRLIRVSQNCENSYGEGLVFSEVDSVYPQYREHVVKKVFPRDLEIADDREFEGIHTYNRLGNLEVIDLKFYEPSFREYRAARRTHKVFLNKYSK